MGWRHDTREAIRKYPELTRRDRELKETALIAQYGGRIGGRSTEASRTAETAAMRQLPRDEQRQLDAVASAVQTTMRYRNGELRVKLIDLVYWRGTHTLTGAAVAIHVSTDTASRWHNGFVELVDAYLRVL